MCTTLHTKRHTANWKTGKNNFPPYSIHSWFYTVSVTYFPKHYFSSKVCVYTSLVLGYTVKLTTGSNFMRKQKNSRMKGIVMYVLYLLCSIAKLGTFSCMRKWCNLVSSFVSLWKALLKTANFVLWYLYTV